MDRLWRILERLEVKVDRTADEVSNLRADLARQQADLEHGDTAFTDLRSRMQRVEDGKVSVDACTAEHRALAARLASVAQWGRALVPPIVASLLSLGCGWILLHLQGIV